jgi:hypothetical protein
MEAEVLLPFSKEPLMDFILGNKDHMTPYFWNSHFLKSSQNFYP